MLTCPSDSVPKIVCPMDEDVIPPNPVCSAPPHSEPPPPLLPFSYITPSCINDGLCRNRRSDRIQATRGPTQKKQGCTDSRAAQKPSRQNLSPAKRQRERMVQVSQSKQLKVERTHVHENPQKDGDDITFTRECQNGQKDPEIPQRKMDIILDKNVVEPSEEKTTPNLDVTVPDMDTCEELPAAEDTGNISTSRGWVIGPLFQSLKSKMASFTEIVMTPVKLFRANSPPPSKDHSDKLDVCELRVDAAADEETVKRPDIDDMFCPGGQKENQDTKIYQQTVSDIEDAQRAEIVPKFFKKLEFDDVSAQQSEQTAEITLDQKEEILPDLMPLPHRPLACVDSQQVSESFESTLSSSMLLRASTKASASHEFKLKTSRAAENKKDKPLTQQKHLLRKHTKNSSELQKVDARPLTSEVKKQLIYPKVNDKKLFSQQSLVKLNKIDLCETNKTLPLSSSVCCAVPDADCHQPNDSDAFNAEGCRSVRQSFRNSLSNGANKTSQRPALDSSQMECQSNSEMCPVSSYVRAKRGMTINCHSSQDDVKRKRVMAISQMDETKIQQVSNMVSDSEMTSWPKAQREAFVLSTIANEGIIKPAEKRQIISKRANRKGKGGQEMKATREEVIINQTKRSSNGMLVCSQEKSGVSHDHLKDSSSQAKPSGSCKRLKTRAALGDPHLNNDGTMDLETTLAVTSTKQAEEEPLSELLVHADLKQVQCTGKCRNTNKNSLKRKSPNHVSSVTETGTTFKSTSSVELMTTNFSASRQVKKINNLTKGLSKSSKRPKNGLRGDTEPLVSTKPQETKRCVTKLHLITKDSQFKNCKNKISVDPEYFESTPFVSALQPAPSPSKPPPMDSYVQLSDEEKNSITDEIFLTDSDIRNRSRSNTKQVGVKRRRADGQRRRCRILHSRTRKGEKVTKSATMEDADLAASRSSSLENGSSRCLLRSYSCPEILSLHPHDSPWTSSLHSPQHSRTHSSHHHSLFHSHAHKSVRRARRHTVCSVEVERELAPLCLRKEVYPSRRSSPYDHVTQHLSGSHTHSPSTSLSVLAACFLSSPLAFLSKKVDCRGAAASPSTSSCFPSSSSSPTSPVSSSTWHSPSLIPKTDSSDTLESSSRNPLPCDSERRQPSEEEDDGEDTSSSSQEFEDVGLTEEKALSDSEIKVVQKHEEQRKVSSIRIRRTLPKPQTNLTPMGLPKPIRVKKKEFTLEEIYTNKNYSKPPESRLESIFEVPLTRRDGSEAWFGQRRVKRFLEFLEGGEARKPKKPLVGVGKVGISGSRTRRGGFSKDGPSLNAQDVDSLLCSKLDQLNLWLVHDQKDR